MAETFEVGDRVRLKTGGPTMIVVKVLDASHDDAIRAFFSNTSRRPLVSCVGPKEPTSRGASRQTYSCWFRRKRRTLRRGAAAATPPISHWARGPRTTRLTAAIMMAHNLDDDPGDAETQGRTAQTMCLLRVLVGKLNEAHETIQCRYLRAGLRSKLEGEFDEQVRASIQKFLTYFDNPRNNINVLRKKVAFHNDWEFARQNVQSLPHNAALFVYTDETVGNTLFHFADLGVAFIMSNHVNPGNFAAGLDTITDEARDLAHHLLRFTTACLGVLLGRHVPMVQDQVEVHPTCGLQDARIPFFMSRS